MDTRLKEICQRKGKENYIAPFFWQHGESDEVLLEEIKAIAESGIQAVCVEARPHEEFGKAGWWQDMDLILKECSSRGMKVWLLDDKHFPTGYANGLLAQKDARLRRWEITEKHMDVVGPVEDAAVMAEGWSNEEDKIIAVLACEREKGKEKLTGKVINVTDKLFDGLVYLTLPEGCWRIIFLLQTRSTIAEDKKLYCDALSSESMDVLLEAVYEPHWEHYKEYFGNTFAGFFSDEPGFQNNLGIDVMPTFGNRFYSYPWREELMLLLEDEYGCDPLTLLPALWYDMPRERTAKARVGYMNVITKLYQKNFSQKLGNWCRTHGVEYIGHIIEDNNAHTKTGFSAGHFFRSMEGQDMAGIDVVLHQIVPGFTEYDSAAPVCYQVIDAEFFHYALAKLGISLAQQDPKKKGRLMCEIFGAYGWAEGLKTMKWLVDHMLVRGVNFFVPHAFSPTFPDLDCPPHFYAGGNNPQYRDFKLLMEYMNRMCHLLSDGKHVVSCGILYQAESEWSGGVYQPMQKAAKALFDRQFDYEFVPSDYLENAFIQNHELVVGNQTFPCLVIPQTSFLPEKLIEKVKQFAEEGLLVIYVDEFPTYTLEGETLKEWFDKTETISLHNLASFLTERLGVDIKMEAETHSLYLRSYHYRRNGADCYLLFNEDIHHTIHTELSISSFHGGTYLKYNGMENTCVKAESKDGKISLELPPYQSVMLCFGEVEGDWEKEFSYKTEKEVLLEGDWRILSATEQEYPKFTEYEAAGKLRNLSAKGELPRFSGHFGYEKTFCFSKAEGKKYFLDCGKAGETVHVILNGEKVGVKLVPPYRFDITNILCDGENHLFIEVINHLGYQERDGFSKFLVLEPSGLLGSVSVLEQVLEHE